MSDQPKARAVEAVDSIVNKGLHNLRSEERWSTGETVLDALLDYFRAEWRADMSESFVPKQDPAPEAPTLEDVPSFLDLMRETPRRIHDRLTAIIATDRSEIERLRDELRVVRNNAHAASSAHVEAASERDSLKEENTRLRAQLDELEQTMDLWRKAFQRAVDEWRRDNPDERELICPDLAAHVVWAFGEVGRLRAKVRGREEAGPASEPAYCACDDADATKCHWRALAPRCPCDCHAALVVSREQCRALQDWLIKATETGMTPYAEYGITQILGLSLEGGEEGEASAEATATEAGDEDVQIGGGDVSRAPMKPRAGALPRGEESPRAASSAPTPADADGPRVVGDPLRFTPSGPRHHTLAMGHPDCGHPRGGIVSRMKLEIEDGYHQSGRHEVTIGDGIPLTPEQSEIGAVAIAVIRDDPQSIEAGMLRGMLASWKADRAAAKAAEGE